MYLNISVHSPSEDYDYAYLLANAFGKSVEVKLPTFIKPIQVQREYNGKSYKELIQRQYGICLFEEMLTIYYGADPWNADLYGDKTQSFSYGIPWLDRRMTEHRLLDLTGNEFSDVLNAKWEDQEAIEKTQPSETYIFADFDGEVIKARVSGEERAWRQGTKWCKWIGYIWPKLVSRCIDINFSAEVGERKGRYKGGTLGHSGELNKGESFEDAFKRYCLEHKMTFQGLDPASPAVGRHFTKAESAYGWDDLDAGHPKGAAHE